MGANIGHVFLAITTKATFSLSLPSTAPIILPKPAVSRIGGPAANLFTAHPGGDTGERRPRLSAKFYNRVSYCEEDLEEDGEEDRPSADSAGRVRTRMLGPAAPRTLGGAGHRFGSPGRLRSLPR